MKKQLTSALLAVIISACGGPPQDGDGTGPAGGAGTEGTGGTGDTGGAGTEGTGGTGGGLGPSDTPNWHEGVLPQVDPLSEEDVVREESGRKLYPIPGSDHRFWVYLPPGYDSQEPSGMLLFMHGSYDGADDINPWFHNWEGAFGSENMVFIKMSFRDNSSSDDAHLQSTLYAIAAVANTYDILLGRGVLTGFSRGGFGISRLVDEYGGWPFNHILGESIIYAMPIPESLQPMSWTMAVGQHEWDSWDLGTIASDRISEVYKRVDDGGSLDLHMQVVAGEGHGVLLADSTIAAAVPAYRRSASFYAPFVYRPDFADPELQHVVDVCQSLNLGHAHQYLEQLIASDPGAYIEEKATRLGVLLTSRIDEMFAILTALQTLDPVLAEHYMSAGLYQLRGHPRRAEMQMLADNLVSASGFASSSAATSKWYQEFDGYITVDSGGASLVPEHLADVQEVAAAVSSTSVVGLMLAEFLAL